FGRQRSWLCISASPKTNSGTPRNTRNTLSISAKPVTITPNPTPNQNRREIKPRLRSALPAAISPGGCSGRAASTGPTPVTSRASPAVSMSSEPTRGRATLVDPRISGLLPDSLRRSGRRHTAHACDTRRLVSQDERLIRLKGHHGSHDEAGVARGSGVRGAPAAAVRDRVPDGGERHRRRGHRAGGVPAVPPGDAGGSEHRIAEGLPVGGDDPAGDRPPALGACSA